MTAYIFTIGDPNLNLPQLLGGGATQGSNHRTSEDDWSVQSPPKRKVFRFHDHSQKVIGFLGIVSMYGYIYLDLVYLYGKCW